MSILLELRNDHFDLIENINLNSCVTAHTEYLNYNKYTDAMSTHLNYFESETQKPEKNIKILDLSEEHPFNNISNIEEGFEEYSGRSFKSTYKDVLITNVVDNERAPLFYKHKRRWNTEPNITIVNENENENLTRSHKYIDGYFYNNYTNNYNYEDDSYQLIFLSGIDENGISRTELLNNESAIEELSWRDLNISILDNEDLLSNPSAGISKINSYTKSQSGNGFEYNIILVNGFCESEKENKIYVKQLSKNSIYLKKPININQKNSWFLSINNGFFYSRKKYFVPEYDYQNFNPEYGILKVYDKECYILNKFNNGSIIKTLNENILLDSSLSLEITVKFLNFEEKVYKVFTSNEELVGTEYLNGINYEDGIASIDSRNGVIALKEDIFVDPNKAFEEEVKIRADYFYKCEEYIYQKLDLNPSFNEDILNYKYYFYLKPNMDFKESVFWLKLDSKNNIKDFNDKSIAASSSREEILSMSLNSFKDTYCYGYGSNDNLFLELGEVNYCEDTYLDEATILDVRDSTPINEETFEDYLNRQHKVLQSSLGYGDKGQVYQENNIVIVDAPKELLIEFGGQYTESEIYDLLKLKSSPGLEIILNWESKKPKIVIEPLSNSEIYNQNLRNKNEITIKIEMEGLGEYILYRCINKNEFNKENTSQIFYREIITENEIKNLIISQDGFIKFVDTLNERNKTYYYKVIYNGIYESDFVGFKTRQGN